MKEKNGIVPILIISLVIFSVFLVIGYINYSNRYRSPYFVGYRSRVLRINPLDLGEVQRKALQSGFTVDNGTRSEKDEHFDIPTFLGSRARGVETSRDTSRVGELWLEYDSGAELHLRTDYTRIMYETESDGVEVLMIIKIDNETDIELFLECDERIKNPKKIFHPAFEKIGTPVSVLNKISMDEIEVAVCGTA